MNYYFHLIAKSCVWLYVHTLRFILQFEKKGSPPVSDRVLDFQSEGPVLGLSHPLHHRGPRLYSIVSFRKSSIHVCTHMQPFFSASSTIVFPDFFRALGAYIDVVLTAVWPTVYTQLAPVRTLCTPTSVETGRECQSGWWFSQKQSKWYWGDGFHLLYSYVSRNSCHHAKAGTYLAVGSHLGSLALVYFLGNECSPASQPLHNRSSTTWIPISLWQKSRFPWLRKRDWEETPLQNKDNNVHCSLLHASVINENWADVLWGQI